MLVDVKDAPHNPAHNVFPISFSIFYVFDLVVFFSLGIVNVYANNIERFNKTFKIVRDAKSRELKAILMFNFKKNRERENELKSK